MNEDYRRVERAIRFLEDHLHDQPGLEEVAEQVHLSPYHFQRLFTRWAGVSPKRFLEFLTLERAKDLLGKGSQLEAAYRAGLSSPSRLHDLFVTIDAVTPGEYKRLGSGLEIAYGLHRSPFGDCLVAVTDRGLCGLSFVEAGGARAELQDLRRRWPGARLREDPDRSGEVAGQAFGPLAGWEHPDGPDRPYGQGRSSGQSRFPLPLLLKGTNFQLKVWEALLRIPPGRVSSYGRLAEAIGKPGAGRAVGAAVGANPIAYLIPCHRVILESGAFGNYRYGSARKKAILGWEQARLERIG
ncbi:MAG: methylated-DNA--[protein]-cysteine S-methyltransferase [Spirochaetales bacterium]|nr:methylated-DNA--[protein]-cysteine S-methyltransferase [Spirochaetales bacterium]